MEGRAPDSVPQGDSSFSPRVLAVGPPAIHPSLVQPPTPRTRVSVTVISGSWEVLELDPDSVSERKRDWTNQGEKKIDPLSAEPTWGPGRVELHLE